MLIGRGEGHWDEAERWLREVADLDSRNEHSRVELARLLIRRGEEHWGEAEDLLREVAKRNPRSAQSCVFSSVLLEKQGKRTDAIKMLEKFIKKWGHNSGIQAQLERLRTGSTSDVIEGLDDDFDQDINWDKSPVLTRSVLDGKVLQIEVQTQHDEIDRDTNQAELQVKSPELSESIQKKKITTSIVPLRDTVSTKNTDSLMEDSIAGIRRRAELQGEFMRAQFASSEEKSKVLQMLSESARNGNDGVAGLYQQLLNADSEIKPPPHAWAWQSCRLYQKSTDKGWEQLEGACPEKRLYTDFIHYCASGNSSDQNTELLRRIDRQKERRKPEENTTGRDTRPPIETFIFSTHERFMMSLPTKEQRDSAALAVFCALVADAPRIAAKRLNWLQDTLVNA